MPQPGHDNAVLTTDRFPATAAARHSGEDGAAAHPIQPASVLGKVHVVRAGLPSLASSRNRQSARIRRLLMAGGLAMLYLVCIGTLYLQGLVTLDVLRVAVCLSVMAFLVFRSIFALGWNLKAEEKNLRLPITLTSIAIMLYVLYLSPAAHIAFIPFLFLTMAFVMHRISPRRMLLLTIATLAGYGLVVWLHSLRKDGSLLTLECAQLLVLAVTMPGFAVLADRMQRLHSALYKANRKIRDIEEDAQRDVMLGCFNRRYIVAALEQQKRLADETGSSLCLAVIDLDHFKRINDEAGHLVGDEVLRIFAGIAQGNVRDLDVFGRYGGEEFLLVLPETSLLSALNVAERIREQVEHFDWDGKLRNGVTISIGLTQYVAGESVLDLFSRTDTAMYMAKQGGRNQVVVEELTPEPGNL